MASCTGRLKIIKMLINSGADVDQTTTEVSYQYLSSIIFDLEIYNNNYNLIN